MLLYTSISLNVGHLIIASSVFFFALASYAVLFSAFLPLSGFWPLDILATDAHYKYVLILLIPTTFYFVIANWVGWEYYRNS
ncbi:hypothetical protein M413DRAFT_60633 [Hebeloma cylindrosporum]|uniref:PIG-P domain-containing protein n=1 Tax=Hebeloma cylindrosporum TaxID=76867 RepID=A0A0C3CZC6_HEBCY|nr:hypothetical protein M413DRAFT_60633 [Hebeloma cylindrosporum h7]